MRSQHAQASFGRTCRITLKRAGTYSNISETSSPRCFNAPPQSGQAVCFGGYFRVSRGRCSGSGRRAGFAAFAADTAAAGVCEATTFSACVASSSSSRNSNCSISRPSFSDLRPNCIRRSLASSNFKCSISLSREVSCSSFDSSCSRCVRMSTFSSLGFSASRSGRGWLAAAIAANLADFLYSKIKMGKKNETVLLTPPSAARNCAPAAANRSLPAASTTAPASAKPCRSPLAAK